MTAILNLDLRNTQADTGADPIPAGWYMAMIDESSLAATSKDPNNKMLKLRFNVLDGQFAGRKVFTNFNIIHTNPMTQEIAQKQLKAVCVAVGHHGMLADSGELHGKPLRIKVKVRKATDDYEASNDVTSYLGKDAPLPASATTAVAQAAAPALAQAAAPAFPSQPWSQNAPAAPAMPPANTGAPMFPAQPAAAAPAPATNVPWASAPATVAAPAMPPAFAAPAPAAPAAPAPVAPAAPVKRMTEKAAGATYEQFASGGWTDENMVREGYLVIEQPAAPSAPAAPAAPTAPAMPPAAAPAPAAAPGTPMTPPWATA